MFLPRKVREHPPPVNGATLDPSDLPTTAQTGFPCTGSAKCLSLAGILQEGKTTSKRSDESGTTSLPGGLRRSRLRGAFEKLGGKSLVGSDVQSDIDLIGIMQRGLPLDTVAALVRDDDLPPQDVDKLIIPRRTLAHRKARNQPLSAAESERLLRVASIIALAEDTFVSAAKAQAWLRRPTSALSGKRPLDLLASEPGGRVVEQLLDRIAHGIAA